MEIPDAAIAFRFLSKGTGKKGMADIRRKSGVSGYGDAVTYVRYFSDSFE